MPEISKNINVAKVKGYFELTPFMIPLIYVLGFLIINSFLNEYHYTEYTFFSISFLKAGLLYSTMWALVFIVIYITNYPVKKDEIKPWIRNILVIHNLLFVSFFVYLLFGGSKLYLLRDTNQLLYNSLFMLPFLVYAFIRLFVKEKTEKQFLIKYIILIILLVTILASATINNFSIWKIYFFIFTSSLMIFLYFNDFFSNKFKHAEVLSFSIFIIGSSIYFGKHVYKELPGFVGGGATKRISLFIKENKTTLLPAELQNSNKIDSVYLIYSNDKEYLIQLNSKKRKIFSVNKDLVSVVEYLNN